MTKALGLNKDEALAVSEYVNSSESIIVEALLNEALSVVEDGMALREFAERLNVDEYRAVWW